MPERALRILVTNDDSVSSLGLWHLAAALRGPGRDVVVAAPSRDSSGFAAAVGDISPGSFIEWTAAEWPAPWSIADTPAWAVEGPPGRCVLGGLLGVFGPVPDLVVSGINAGANTGRFLQLHSGTLGAALTAANFGLRSMAVSLDIAHGPGAGPEPRWDVAGRVADSLVEQLLSRPGRTVWNVNVPNVPWEELAGVTEVRIGPSRNAMQAHPAGDGRHELRMVPAPSRAPSAAELPGDRDVLDDGWVAVTSVTPPGLVPVGEIEFIRS